MNLDKILNIFREGVRRIKQPAFPSKSFVSFGDFYYAVAPSDMKLLPLGCANVFKVQLYEVV